MRAIGHAALSYPPSPADIDAGRKHGRPNPAQAAFEALDPRVKIAVLIAGFGTGKSTVGARVDLISMLRNPGSHGMVIGPTYRHTEIVRTKIEEMLERIRQETGIQLVEHVTRSRGQSSLRLTNGSEVALYTAQNRVSWMGPDITWIHLDEWEWFEDPGSVMDGVIHRLREQTVPGIRTIHEHRVFVTSTAQTVSGPLRGMIERAQAERRKAEEAPGYIPEVAVVVAPSTMAIGYGLTLDMIRTWRANMDERTFGRAVMCDLSPPPEVVYADYVDDANIVDWHFEPTCKTFWLFDWGIHHSAWIAAQWSPQHNALVLLQEWAPGPEEPASVGDAVAAAVKQARAWGLVDARGRPVTRGTMEAIGDPTPNPRQYTRQPREDEMLAAEGDRLLRGMGWTYRAPLHPRQRSKHNQVTLMRMLLHPRQSAPRILVARHLTTDPDRMTRMSRTKRGIWQGLTTGLRYRRNRLGQLEERIDKATGYDHLHDALCYGAVMVFADEFDRLLHQEYGLLSGAAAWST